MPPNQVRLARALEDLEKAIAQLDKLEAAANMVLDGALVDQRIRWRRIEAEEKAQEIRELLRYQPR